MGRRVREYKKHGHARTIEKLPKPFRSTLPQDVQDQKDKEMQALKDPLANSVNRGGAMQETPQQQSGLDVGLEDVNMDLTNQLSKETNKKDKLKRMLSL